MLLLVKYDEIEMIKFTITVSICYKKQVKDKKADHRTIYLGKLQNPK